MRPGGSIRPMMAEPVIDLPAPDSPTTPSTSPGMMSKEMSSTAVSSRRGGWETRRRGSDGQNGFVMAISAASG